MDLFFFFFLYIFFEDEHGNHSLNLLFSPMSDSWDIVIEDQMILMYNYR